MFPDNQAIVAAVLPVAARYEHLHVADRIALLSGLLVQEICHLPVGDRPIALDAVIRLLPIQFDVTQATKREVLAENAGADQPPSASGGAA